jgi:adenine-specific DNA-methyltransferase
MKRGKAAKPAKDRKSISKPAYKGRAMTKDAPEDGIGQYKHEDKQRPYNPPVGLVTHETDKEAPRKKYAYDPHMDPQLQWAGKAEHTSFEVDTVSLHVHERIDPLTIIEGVMKKQEQAQTSLATWFEQKEQNPPLREAIQFYKHSQNWSNRLIAGDSLLVMNSLLQKEGLAGKVQMVYIDPPYGIKYGSNFQPFVNRREVKDKDEDLTQEPEMVKAFRDTWELGIHSYLTYLQDRLKLSYELLNETGSVFVQISDENVHHVRELLDEVFGENNFVSQIQYRTSGGLSSSFIRRICDYILWYAKDKSKAKFRKIYSERTSEADSQFSWIMLPDGEKRRLTSEEKANAKLIPSKAELFTTNNLVSSGYTQSCIFKFDYEGRTFFPSSGKSWKTTREGMNRLAKKGRLIASGDTLRFVLKYNDFPVMSLTNIWDDLAGAPDKTYIVQTNPKVIQRCILMTTDPGDLVFDPTCGSGSSAFVAEKWGRRWISCDTSRVAIALAKQRLMTTTYDYYTLRHPEEGIAGGFRYATVPNVTLSSLANDEPPGQETLFDKPEIDHSKTRIPGPFTIEAVPSSRVLNFDDAENLPPESTVAPRHKPSGRNHSHERVDWRAADNWHTRKVWRKNRVLAHRTYRRHHLPACRRRNKRAGTETHRHLVRSAVLPA